MTEHNLPEKDDAPWLDTTYDGFKAYHDPKWQALNALEKAMRPQQEDN